MALISLQEISLAFGGPLLFDELSLQLERGERVALLGRNGAGKTTLMKVMAGQLGIDDGEIVLQKGVKVTHLPQEVPSGITGNVFDIVLAGLGKGAKLLSDYHHVAHRLHTEHTDALMRELDRIQHELDKTDGWDLNTQVEEVLTEMKIDPDADFSALSGGQKRRVLLARALVQKPDVLLLDEPTNHLDIEAINWLEGFFKTYPGTIFFVTHDRMFMRNLATRIMELDRGKMFSWACGYDIFLERKKAALEVEAAQRIEFDKKLAEEEVWIRKGVKARRVRNEGRVKALERLRIEKSAQRNVQGQVNMKAQESESSGHLVIKVANLGFSYGDKCLVRNFSTQIMRGDKIGLIGANGSGKTTLLRLILGQLEPQTGKVRLGTNLDIAYYDQLRQQLEEDKTVIENVCGQADTVTINGRPRHIIGYLQDFLFTPDRARTPVKVLSGGERNRLFLARLFTKPSNFLIMDEPTNDLDIETQELLEELLMEYSGTLILVSHDRAFLNNVVTSTMVMEGNGDVHEFPGGYDDYVAQRKLVDANTAQKNKASNGNARTADEPVKPVKQRKLSFKEQKDLEQLPGIIEKLEAEQEGISGQLAEISFYQQDADTIERVKARSEAVMDELLAAYQRWEYLEALHPDPTDLGPGAKS